MIHVLSGGVGSFARSSSPAFLHNSRKERRKKDLGEHPEFWPWPSRMRTRAFFSRFIRHSLIDTLTAQIEQDKSASEATKRCQVGVWIGLMLSIGLVGPRQKCHSTWTKSWSSCPATLTMTIMLTKATTLCSRSTIVHHCHYCTANYFYYTLCSSTRNIR